MAFILCLGVFTLVGGVNVVKAAEDDIGSGIYRGIDWRLTADGELIFGKDGQTQTMTGSGTGWPYRLGDYKTQVTKVSVDGTVKASGSLSYMFYGLTNLTDVD
jgi:hypothetical protein